MTLDYSKKVHVFVKHPAVQGEENESKLLIEEIFALCYLFSERN